jgi:hypothetical protein
MATTTMPKIKPATVPMLHSFFMTTIFIGKYFEIQSKVYSFEFQ